MITRVLVPLIVINLFLLACTATPTVDVERTAQAVVAAALTALPTDTPVPTDTAVPTDTPLPPPTPTETPLPPTFTPTAAATAAPTATFTPAPPTSTPTSPPPKDTPTTAPPTRTPTPAPPTATPTPAVLPAPVLLEPEEGYTAYAWFYDPTMTIFRWQWNGTLPPNTTFEVRVWVPGVDPDSRGAYDVADVIVLPPEEAYREREKRDVERVKRQIITDEGNGIYSTDLDLGGAYSVRREYKTYLWSVAVVQIDPYSRIGLEAPGRPIYIE